MDSDNVPYRQSLLEAIGILSGRWVPAILSSLATGPLTFGDLQSAINDMETHPAPTSRRTALTRKVLTETLGRLQRDSIVQRQAAEDDVPFQNVWYELTSDGEKLLKALRPLIAWEQARTSPTSPSDHA
jgi:DNA-binding HxlR family transcriptional regulator